MMLPLPPDKYCYSLIGVFILKCSLSCPQKVLIHEMAQSSSKPHATKPEKDADQLNRLCINASKKQLSV